MLGSCLVSICVSSVQFKCIVIVPNQGNDSTIIEGKPNNQ